MGSLLALCAGVAGCGDETLSRNAAPNETPSVSPSATPAPVANRFAPSHPGCATVSDNASATYPGYQGVEVPMERLDDVYSGNCGFIKIDAPGLFTHDRYVSAEKVHDVTDDRVTLAVRKNELAEEK